MGVNNVFSGACTDFKADDCFNTAIYVLCKDYFFVIDMCKSTEIYDKTRNMDFKFFSNPPPRKEKWVGNIPILGAINN